MIALIQQLSIMALYALLVGGIISKDKGSVAKVKTIEKMRSIKSITQWLVGLGIILPFIIFLPKIIDSFIDLPEERVNIVAGIFFITIVNVIPFVILTIFIRKHLNSGQINKNNPIFYKRLIGLRAAVIMTFVTSIYINMSIAVSKSSTAPLGFIFLPFYVTLAIPLGYLFGRLLTIFIFRNKAKKPKT